MSTPDFVHTDAKQSASATETPDQSPLLSQTLKPETRPVQIATASVDDVDEVVTAESVRIFRTRSRPKYQPTPRAE